MKTRMTTWVILIALATATSCSETETGIDPEPGSDGQVALGITPNLKVDAGTKASTKSVVSGEVITYPEKQYTSSDYAPGLGVLVTNSDATGWYTPDGTEYTGHHVWYMGDETGTNWISIKEKNSTYDATKEVPYYLTKEVGKVYAYYPYDKNVTSSPTGINSESDLKIPVTVSASGEIDATTSNAKKYWDGTKWASSTSKTPVSLSISAEKDYLYFDATESGRYVNNGRADGQPPVVPDAEPNNTDKTNPGYKINLSMKHAMAMVSFRVYDGGHLSDKDVNFTKFEIKNHDSGSIFKTGDGMMSLVDGAITETSTTTGMERTITNYVLMRQIEDDQTEGEHAFIQSGKTATSVNGQTVSKMVSAVIYPIASFDENQIDVEITLQEGGSPVVAYPVTLPGNTWEAGNNYIYTFSAGRNKLTIVNVTVEKWNDVDQEEIPL